MLNEALETLETELHILGSGGPSVWTHLPREQRDGLRSLAMDCSTASAKLISALAPINKLPPEILGLVPTHFENQTPKDLITITSVCSYWRTTFLSTPSLWTRLDGRGLEMTQAWVKRSRALPLQLQVEGNTPNFLALNWLGLHQSRLEIVDFPDLRGCDLPFFTGGHFRRLLRPNPILRHICIEAEDLDDLTANMVLGGTFPSLEVLRLTGFPVSLAQFRAPNLRHLLLTGSFDLKEILDLLESFPLLERLMLRLDLREDTPIQAGRKVVLGKIFQASFYYHGFKTLQYLSLPVGSDVQLIEDVPFDQLDGSTNEYTRFLCRVYDDLPMSRQIDTVSYYTSGGCRNLLLSGQKGGMELVTHKIEDPVPCITLLRLLTRHSLESLEGLLISNLYVPPSKTDIISDYLKTLPNLRRLMMQQSFACQCLAALGTKYCLRLEGIEVKRPSPWLPDYYGLMKFVKCRSEAGIPIRRLLVSNGFPSSPDPEDMDTLLKYVEYVAWR